MFPGFRSVGILRLPFRGPAARFPIFSPARTGISVEIVYTLPKLETQHSRILKVVLMTNGIARIARSGEN